MTRPVLPDDHLDTGEERLGVLLVNLGTPDAPNAKAVRRYLAEFLWDPRVIEMTRPLWWLILHGLILPFRSRRSANAYSQIWTDAGSPLRVITNDLGAALQQNLTARLPGRVRVTVGMRYGNPSIAEALGQLHSAAARRVFVLPLYPQYSGTTTGTVFDAVAKVLTSWRWVPELHFANHYHDASGYINALAASVRHWWSEHNRAEKLLFSFHSIPKKYFDAGDPYHCHCQKTARLTAEALDIAESDWDVSFQSRLGTAEWLQPYTDKHLQQLAGEGIRNIQVICPGFAVDCLETLEELDIRYRELFMAAGGENFEYIPALNTRTDHIQFLTELIVRQSAGWPETDGQPL